MTEDDEDIVIVWGVCRNEPNKRKSHAYIGPSYHKLEGPLCIYGWNRSDGQGFSIFRGHGSEEGSCLRCQKKVLKGDLTVAPHGRVKTRWL